MNRDRIKPMRKVDGSHLSSAVGAEHFLRRGRECDLVAITELELVCRQTEIVLVDVLHPSRVGELRCIMHTVGWNCCSDCAVERVPDANGTVK